MTDFYSQTDKIVSFKLPLMPKTKKPKDNLIPYKEGCGALVRGTVRKRCRPCGDIQRQRIQKQIYLRRKQKKKDMYNRDNATTKRSPKTKSSTTV